MFRKSGNVVLLALATILLCFCSLPAHAIEQPEAAILSLAPQSTYYFDERTGALVYFAKDLPSTAKRPTYHLVMLEGEKKTQAMLSLPEIPESHIVENGWVYFTSSLMRPDRDPNYQQKLSMFKKISKYFGDDHSKLFRANLVTNQVEWLGSPGIYLLDDRYIYFMEMPVDLHLYGYGNQKGCKVRRNSLCRMGKDGSDPMLIQAYAGALQYITDKYIYTTDAQIDKVSFQSKARVLPPQSKNTILRTVIAKDKTFYIKRETDAYAVYCEDVVAKSLLKVAAYPQCPIIIPLPDGGCVICHSDSSKLANISFFDQDCRLVKTVQANGRSALTVHDNKMFYILEEIKDRKARYRHLPGSGYSTQTLCSDDLSMQGENVTSIDVIDE